MLTPISLPVSQEHALVLPNAPPTNYTTHSSEHIICSWDIGGRVPCGAYIKLADLPKHLRIHGVIGPAKRVMACEWGSCERAPMNRESIIRHIDEVHLLVKYSCNQCGASFSRRSTLNAHLSNYHA